MRAEACSDSSSASNIGAKARSNGELRHREALTLRRAPQRSSSGASRLRCTILSSRARRNRLPERSDGGRTRTLSALGGGLASLLASLLAGLFSFLLFFHPLLLNLIVRRSLLKLDAVAPCALKGFEGRVHLSTGISIARLHSLPATLLNRAARRACGAIRWLPVDGVTLSRVEEIALG